MGTRELGGSKKRPGARDLRRPGDRFEQRGAFRGETRRGTEPDAQICLDFTQCEFIDAGGLRLVLHTARDMRAEGGELSVDKLRGEVARIFEITGMLVEGSPVVRGAAQTPRDDSPG
ncbi:MAG TPA: STAS domain-containing protein [Solirubrobacterales bacterium]|nr:STAS domain-containing protein [Solirubrobacterales bacterium]